MRSKKLTGRARHTTQQSAVAELGHLPLREQQPVIPRRHRRSTPALVLRAGIAHHKQGAHRPTQLLLHALGVAHCRARTLTSREMLPLVSGGVWMCGSCACGGRDCGSSQPACPSAGPAMAAWTQHDSGRARTSRALYKRVTEHVRREAEACVFVHATVSLMLMHAPWHQGLQACTMAPRTSCMRHGTKRTSGSTEKPCKQKVHGPPQPRGLDNQLHKGRLVHPEEPGPAGNMYCEDNR